MEIGRLESTSISNAKYIISARNAIVGIVMNLGCIDEQCYMAMDRVELVPDNHGYICPGIRHATNKAVISEIVRHDTDHWLHIVCENGEEGFCKPARVKVIRSCEHRCIAEAGLI